MPQEQTDYRKREQPQTEREADGRFLPGCSAGPGRRKGTPNQTTVDSKKVKEAILATWDSINGPKLLAAWAKENFGEYLRILVKLLPRDDTDKLVSSPWPTHVTYSDRTADEILAGVGNDNTGSPDTTGRANVRVRDMQRQRPSGPTI